MTDNTFPCTECAQRISRAGALSGSYVACPHCGSLVSVPKPTAAAQPDMSGYVIPPAGIWRAVPLWLIFGVGFLLCAIVLGLIYANLQRNSREQATFLDTLRAAENAETPDAGTRLITQFLEQARLDSGQKLQAHSLLALLQKRAQVDAAMAAAHRDEEARKMAAAAADAAARQRIDSPLSPPEPTLADARDMYEKGVRLACGDGVLKDYAAAAALIGSAAAIGLPAAQHDMAAIQAEGIGCATNLYQALEWGRKAADQGDREAQAWMGYRLATGAKGIPPDFVQAAQWNRKAAAQGQVLAMLNLGIQYANGQGMRRDFSQAIDLLTAAAARGSADAHAILGVMHWKGLGVSQDPTNAFRAFQKAHEMGNTQGTFALGLLYGSGSGVAKDRQMAAACFLAAARNGHVGAQKQIGRMFFTASGVSWSEQDAIYWFRMAAAQGDAYALQAVDAYRNTHLPPVFAPCTACAAKGTVTRSCAACRGSGSQSRIVTSKSIRSCSCGWQMVNGRCPNCGRSESNSRTVTVPCATCDGVGSRNVSCGRCGGSGQVRVAGPAQDTFAQMLSRPDPGIVMDFASTYTPVQLLPFRTGVNRGGGI